MARYTCSYIARVSLERLQPLLVKVLEECGFDTIYQTNDYMMAREIPGKINFAKLVTVEVLIDYTKMTGDEVQVNFVIKNEELPLQLNNHCRQMFDYVQQALAEDRYWQLIENVVP